MEFITLTPQPGETYLATDEPWDKGRATPSRASPAPLFAASAVATARGGLPLVRNLALLNAHGISPPPMPPVTETILVNSAKPKRGVVLLE